MSVPPGTPLPTGGPVAPYPGFSSYAAPRRTPSGGTAETLALVALIFQVLGSLLILFLGLIFLPAALFFGGLFGLLVLTIAGSILVVTLLLLYIGYAFSYRRIRDGDYEGARSATLVLGILMLFFAIIPGVLYLVAYTKLDDAVRERGWYGGAPVLNPYSTGYPLGLPPPPGPICPRCGRAAAFVPQYGRYYCYSCNAYL